MDVLDRTKWSSINQGQFGMHQISYEQQVLCTKCFMDVLDRTKHLPTLLEKIVWWEERGREYHFFFAPLSLL